MKQKGNTSIGFEARAEAEPRVGAGWGRRELELKPEAVAVLDLW